MSWERGRLIMWEFSSEMQEKFCVYCLCFQEAIFSSAGIAGSSGSLILSCLGVCGGSPEANVPSVGRKTSRAWI
jgi:hypothetical protein